MFWHLAKPARLPLSISFKSSSQISTKPAWTSMEIHAALRTYTRGEKCKMTSEWLSANDVHIVQSSSALQLMEETRKMHSDASEKLKDCESMCVCELSNELKERECVGAYERFGFCEFWLWDYLQKYVRMAKMSWKRESVCLFICVYLCVRIVEWVLSWAERERMCLNCWSRLLFWTAIKREDRMPSKQLSLKESEF